MTDAEAPVLSAANLSYLLMNPPETLPPLNFYPPKEPEPVKLPLPVQLPPSPPSVAPTPTTPLTLKQKLRQKFSGLAETVDSLIPEFSGFDDVALKVRPLKRDPPPTAPPLASSEPPPTSPPLPPSAVGLFQKISTRTSALSLFHEGVGVADLLAADVKLIDMQRAGYNLVDVHLLVPQFEFLPQLGLDKSLFGVKVWKVQDLAKQWGLQLQHVCTQLNFLAQDFVRCGFSLSDMQTLGLTMKTLIDLGAGFDFLSSFQEIPYEISARLSGTKEDLKRMNLSQEQKEWLCVERGWSSVAMLSSFGLDARTVKLLWLAPPPARR